MARTSKIVDVFLSSPSDVNDERVLVSEVSQEWNSLHSKDMGVFINVLTWEDTVAPALNDRAQTAINEQIGDEYDVYIGIMWGRFGSSTGKAESGTVEEFERALLRFRQGNNVRVCMYFKQADIPFRLIDTDQLGKVKEFQSRYSEEGGFYKTFSSDQELRTSVLRLFQQIANEHAPENEHTEPKPLLSGGAARAQSEPSNREGSTASVAPSEIPESEREIDDIGLIEWNEDLEAAATGQAEFLSGWSDLMGKHTALTEQSTSDLQNLSKFGSPDPDAVKEVMRTLSRGLDELSSYIVAGLPAFSSGNDEILSLVEVGYDLLGDLEDNSSRNNFIESVKALLEGAKSNKESTIGMLDSLSAIPRLSKVFNKSRNVFIRAQNGLIGEMSRLEEGLSSALNRFESL